MIDELKPCPFCGEPLKHEPIERILYHPANRCLLSGGGIKDAFAELWNIRASDTSVKHGYWIDHHSGGTSCSVCKRWKPAGDHPKYCENCGSRMNLKRKDKTIMTHEKDIQELEHILNERIMQVSKLTEENVSLKRENKEYQDFARLYGIDAKTMLTLAKSQIKTCANSIRMDERMQDILSIFKQVPEELTDQDLRAAIAEYDGDGTKPYCDLVYCGLDIIRKYLKKKKEYEAFPI